MSRRSLVPIAAVVALACAAAVAAIVSDGSSSLSPEGLVYAWADAVHARDVSLALSYVDPQERGSYLRIVQQDTAISFANCNVVRMH